MKLLRNYFLFILSMSFIFWSCKKDEFIQKDDNLALNNKTFAIYDISGKQCQYLEPSLLKTIEKDLIGKGKKVNAIKLMEQYDNITGVLKGSEFSLPILQHPEENIELGSNFNSFKAGIPGLTGQGHVEAIGWQPLTVLNSTTYVGTVGQSKRLEAFIMNFGNFNPSTCPQIDLSMKNGLGVWKTVHWAQICGTTGQSLANYYVAMHLIQPPSGNPYYQVWYKAHNKFTGWGNWCGDSQIAGTNERLEAVAMYITTMY